jgi:hypothetical protein
LAQVIRRLWSNRNAPIAASRIVPADRGDWTYRTTGEQVAVDPVLGRIVFPPSQARRQAVWVSYAYGFSADLGGGEYERTLSQPPGARIYQVGGGARFVQIGAALAAWRQDAPVDAVTRSSCLC